MADKAITDLNVVPGSIDDGNTWFAVAQSGAAYKVSGHQFILAMASIWESHGCIRDIVYTEPVAPSLTGTLTITLADETEVSFDVENGKGITSITKTGTVDLVDTYTIAYNDGTTTSFTVTNGEKGDTGDAWYVWIRYAGEEPTQDSDIGTDPDNWMGVYSGTSSTAPVHYTDYDWFQIKGAKGDTGDAATIVSQSVSYQQGDSPNIQPTGTWLPTIPTVAQGKYLWTKTDITFNSGSPITFFSVARMGIDGAGSVSSVNGQSPDGNGNVTVTATDIQTTDSTSVQSDLTGLKNTLNSKVNTSAIVNNVTTESDGYVLDARQGKAVNDRAVTIADGLAYHKAGNTANTALSIGTYIYLTGNSTLPEGIYRVKSAISSGATYTTSNLTRQESGASALNTLVDGGSGYVNLPDGTMIQYGATTVTASGTMTQILSTGIYYGVFNLDFPKAFASNNYRVFGSARYSTGFPFTFAGFPYTSGRAFVYVYDFHARAMSDGNMMLQWMAIGRWK